MAKSLRSKWRRKCRAVKRVRYGEKELERLKKVLANDPLNKTEAKKEVLMQIEEVANVVTGAEIAQSSQAETEDIMDLDEVKKKFNPRTLRDEHGAYPVWVHPRKLKSTKKNKKKKMKAKKGVKRNN